MASWDENSPRLRRNLVRVLREARDSARRRETPTASLVRHWHRGMMEGMEVPDPAWIGTFRGEPGAEDIQMRVGDLHGVPASEVGAELSAFFAKLERAIALLDDTLGGGGVENEEHLRLVIRTAAWTHAEWVRIPPFANGNGRTARLWTNWLLMRFGLAPFVRLRPRPAGDAYARAGAEAMRGNWRPTLAAFEGLLREI